MREKKQGTDPGWTTDRSSSLRLELKEKRIMRKLSQTEELVASWQAGPAAIP